MWSHRCMRRSVGPGTTVLNGDDDMACAHRDPGGHKPLRAYPGGRRVVEQFMVKGERGGQGSRTASITVVEPVLVPMSQAERAAAVSAFTEIVAGWWAKHADDERTGVRLPQPLE